MIIIGFRTSVRRLALLQFVCRVCGTLAPQSLLNRTTRFTLFFVPLFPVRSRRTVECGHCGAAYDISRADAERLAV